MTEEPATTALSPQKPALSTNVSLLACGTVPTKPEAKCPSVFRPITRRKIVIQYVKTVDADLPLIVPNILRYVDDEATLRQCLEVNWCFMQAATARLYQTISLFGSSGPVLRRLLKLMSHAAESNTLVDYRSHVRTLEAADLVLDEPEVTPFQSWNLFRELMRRVSPSLEKIYLDSTDLRFRNAEYIQPGTCGLDQRVVFPHLKSLTIGPGCLVFPDSFVIDFLRRCPRDSLVSLRFPGCISQLDQEGYSLIAERGGSALQDLILTPPASYAPPVGDPFEVGSKESTSLVSNYLKQSQSNRASLDLSKTWDSNEMSAGLLEIISKCPDLRALDISGHTQGLKSGVIESLLTNCKNLEELDLPCGVTDAVLSEVLFMNPKHLWRINASCSCYKSVINSPPPTPSPSKSSPTPNIAPCSSLTDTIVRAVIEQILPGKVGALLELPTHLMAVKTAKFVPTLDVLEEIGGAKVDAREPNTVYIPRIGVKVLVPNGSSYVSFK
ncbi:hypothetical protein BCR33DRAFT_718594 [Rhizoclosmatium globosum]|uniref:RNI-like protein n=1 Tax=Rhizoclosmatium globosum TaxID=329046 RepID=A0A1Y2C4U2_9FUNG|nr:hypothetical protein BCR33DRAFT_718594 [Rhizoclosmatium globosum]|eukprot:ORY41956.1 hypothetical protein BCR33DRAFT_718594 [Rhizoclosmatium globosum]